MTKYCFFESQIGRILLLSDGTALTGLYLKIEESLYRGAIEDDTLAVFVKTKKQLLEYFSGERTEFDIPIMLIGSDFQKEVWQQLRKIPFGAKECYGEIAKRIGNPKASRAVGLANGRNPISILVPCHRVVGADGALTGYSGGLENKKILLKLEEKVGQ